MVFYFMLLKSDKVYNCSLGKKLNHHICIAKIKAKEV